MSDEHCRLEKCCSIRCKRIFYTDSPHVDKYCGDCRVKWNDMITTWYKKLRGSNERD